MIAQRIASLLLALWTGSLITVCALAAPTAFAVLERQMAGRIAARLFLAETVIGVAAAALIFIAQRIGGFGLTRGAIVLIYAAAAAPLISHLVLGPLMEAARSAGNMARFGALHGVSALLFAIACVSSLAALWLFNRPAA